MNLTPSRIVRPSHPLAVAVLLVLVVLPHPAAAGRPFDKLRKMLNKTNSTVTGAQNKVTGTLNQVNGVVSSVDSTVTTVQEVKSTVAGVLPNASAEAAAAAAEVSAVPAAVAAPTARTVPAPAAAPGAPAIHPHLELAPVQGSVGSEVELRCVVTDPAGKPLANVPVTFSVRDALPAHDVGGVAWTDAHGVAVVSYVLDFEFNPRSKLTTIRSKYFARVDGSSKFIPASNFGSLSVQR